MTRYLAAYLLIHSTLILTDIRQDDIQYFIMTRLLQPWCFEFYDPLPECVLVDSITAHSSIISQNRDPGSLCPGNNPGGVRDLIPQRKSWLYQGLRVPNIVGEKTPASQGASVAEMFDAPKYENAFWFPQQSMELAVLFKTAKNVEFTQGEDSQVVGQQLFSGSGFQAVHQWLVQNGTSWTRRRAVVETAV